VVPHGDESWTGILKYQYGNASQSKNAKDEWKNSARWIKTKNHISVSLAACKESVRAATVFTKCEPADG
jgi:hypothetical protein